MEKLMGALIIKWENHLQCLEWLVGSIRKRGQICCTWFRELLPRLKQAIPLDLSMWHEQVRG
jgi:hypothetical protein